MKNSIPEGPNPARCTPFTKKNNGITVIGPARVKIKDNFIESKPKFKLPLSKIK